MNNDLISRSELLKVVPSEEVVARMAIANASAVETREEIALNIACDLLNGAMLYGYDYDRIFEEIMKSEGCVSSIQIKEYILNHIEELGKEYFSKGGEEE